MKKKLTEIGITALIVFGAMYLLFAFITVSLDPHKWDFIGRALYILFAVALTLSIS